MLDLDVHPGSSEKATIATIEADRSKHVWLCGSQLSPEIF
jgi:hypothetical protein